MSNSYTIMYEGEVMAGADRETVKENLSRLLKADSSKMDNLFSGNRVVIKRNADAGTAEKYRAAFEKAGAVCILESEEQGEDSMAGLVMERDTKPAVPVKKPEKEIRNHYKRTAQGGQMIITNIEKVPGKEIVEHFGLVSGSTIRAKHIGRDFMASLKNLVGGELKGYTELLQESRKEAMERMMKQAGQLGANAIVNVRFSTSSVAQGAAELYAYGTAVRVD